MSWIGTTRGRLGWASGNVLVYATGGAAYANVKPAPGRCCGNGPEHAQATRGHTRIPFIMGPM
jgi:hypothetical protein